MPTIIMLWQSARPSKEKLKLLGMFHKKFLRCSIFIRRGGSIQCTVKGSCRYSSDFAAGRVGEFISHDKKEAEKAERLLESALYIKSKKTETTLLK